MATQDPTSRLSTIPHQTSEQIPETPKKPRRKHRCMFRDQKGRWWLDFYVRDVKNKLVRRRKLVDGKTREDAERALRAIRTSMDEGTYVNPARTPGFSDFWKMFHERHGHKLDSHQWHGWVGHLKKFFGNCKLSAITPDMIEQYRIERKATGTARDGEGTLADSTINREVQMLRAILGKAVKWRKLAHNPALNVEDYGEGAVSERCLTRTEIRRLLQATKRSRSPLLRSVVYLALETGMRKSEIFNLKWSDVDFESGQLLVRDTKTDEERRVPVSRRAHWLLTKRAARDPLATWVFESRDRESNPAPVSDVKNSWWTALTQARIEDFCFHDLRHTFESHFAMKDGNIYALAVILGHANPKMTLDRYANLSPEYIRSQRAVMDRKPYEAESNGHRMDTRRVLR
jgi:integrase